MGFQHASGLLENRLDRIQRFFEHARDRERFGVLNDPAAGGAGEAQHLLHQEFQPAALLLYEDAVALHLGRVCGKFAAQIIRRGMDDGKRCAQFV